jgi:hypothetical protein
MADNDLADDVLNGMTEICRYLNIKERQGYELAETGRLPLFKLGGLALALSRKSPHVIYCLKSAGRARYARLPPSSDCRWRKGPKNS